MNTYATLLTRSASAQCSCCWGWEHGDAAAAADSEQASAGSPHLAPALSAAAAGNGNMGNVRFGAPKARGAHKHIDSGAPLHQPNRQVGTMGTGAAHAPRACTAQLLPMELLTGLHQDQVLGPRHEWGWEGLQVKPG